MESRKIKIPLVALIIAIIAIVCVIVVILKIVLEEPKIELIGDECIELDVGKDYQEPGVKATYRRKDLTNQVKIETNLDENKLGEYQIKYELTSGKAKAEATRTVKVVDREAPVIKLKGKKTVDIIKGEEEYKDEGFWVTDNYDTEIKYLTREEQIDENSYKIIYEAKDSSGNRAKEERTVNVKSSVIYLTFDDGPSSDITPKILDILKKEDVKATFFLLNYDSSKEKIVKREVEEGHSVGIHGYSHNYKEIYKSEEIYMENLNKLQEKIEKTTGVKTTITRFPGGSSNTVSKFNKNIMTKLTKRVEEEGYKYYDWNVTSGDAGDVDTTEEVYKNVKNGLKKGRANVVLMHDFSNNKKTLNAIEDIIKYGKKNGYEFKTITADSDLVMHHKVQN